MYNLKYHLASLVAVFLALTVGLLLGTVVAERGTLSTQSTTLVSDLQKQFEQIQKDNAVLRAGLEQDRAFAEDAVPVLSAGELVGKTIAVLVNTGRTSGLNATVDAITKAGGTPFVLTLSKSGLGLDSEIPKGLPELLGEKFAEQTTAPASDAFMKALAEAVATELRAGGSRPILTTLEKAGSLKFAAKVDAPVDACAVVTSFDNSADAFSFDIAAALAARGAVVAGVQGTMLDTGVAVGAVDRGLSAVDDVDSPRGMFSLVWVLSGQATGYYGVGAGADALYPPIKVKN